MRNNAQLGTRIGGYGLRLQEKNGMKGSKVIEYLQKDMHAHNWEK